MPTKAQLEARNHNNIRWRLGGAEGALKIAAESPLLTAEQQQSARFLLDGLRVLLQNMGEERRDPTTGQTRPTVQYK